MGLSRPVWVAAGTIALAAIGVTPPAAFGQAAVRSVHMSVDLAPDDGAAEVHMQYVLRLEGQTSVRFELLGFGDAIVDGFWLGARRTGAPMTLTRESGSLRATDLTLNFGGGANEMPLEIRYLIADAVERDGEKLRVHVPVLSAGLPPDGAGEDVFSADVTVPEAWRVSEGFPTGLEPNDDGSLSVALPVVPSVVSLRARADGAWRPGLPLAIDVLAALILLAFAGYGWRHLRGVARGATATEASG